MSSSFSLSHPPLPPPVQPPQLSSSPPLSHPSFSQSQSPSLPLPAASLNGHLSFPASNGVDTFDLLYAGEGERDGTEWAWSDIDKPALRLWLTDTRHRFNGSAAGTAASALTAAAATTSAHIAGKDEMTDSQYRDLLIDYGAAIAAAADVTADGAAWQPPSPLSPDSAELAGGTTSEDEERERDMTAPTPTQRQKHHSAQQHAAAGGEGTDDEGDRRDTLTGQKRRRDNGSSGAHIATDSEEDERDNAESEEEGEEDEDEWDTADDRDAAGDEASDERMRASTPPPSSAATQTHNQPASPTSASSSVGAHANKQRRGAAMSGPFSLFDPPPYPLRSLRSSDGDLIDPTKLKAVDDATDGVDPLLQLPSVPRPAPHTSLFDSLYSVPAEVVYDLRDESETDSEDEAAIASRLRLGCRFTALAGRRFAVPREPATFGWDWQASIALANRAGPLPVAPTATSLPSASSASPSPALSSTMSSSSPSSSSSSSSSAAPSVVSLSFPASVEPGVAAHDGFDLPPVALPFAGFASVTMEEADDERQRKRRRREDEARQHIPLAYRMRLDEMRDRHRGRASNAASPALSTHGASRFFADSTRLSHSPSSLLHSSSLPSTPSSSSALLSLLDPPMPSKRWRQAWAALTQQLPQPVRAIDLTFDSDAAAVKHPLSPHAAGQAEDEDALAPTPAPSSSPSPLAHSQPQPASISVSASSPHTTGRDTPSLPSAVSSSSPPSSPRLCAIVSVSSSSPSYASMSARRLQCRVLADLCFVELRRRAARSLRLLRDTSSFAQRLTRDMALYWRRHDREVVDMRRRLEREEAERRKKEFELREAERQRKKLEFLLTQTELYSHFIGSKMGITAAAAGGQRGGVASSSGPQSTAELNRMERDERMAGMTEDAAQAARQFMESKQRQTAQFDADMNTKRTEKSEAAAATEETMLGTDDSLLNPSTMPEASLFQPCPASFVGSLKSYQLKGMNWLINLYDQGINGILADEMGLGKTIQSIAFLAFLSSVRQFWGPFLVVCPNSTLHQWQQEVSKFCPSLRVLPYWGSQQDRALLRKYWTPHSLGSADSSFHVLVTSYHTIVADAKYFNRLKWQYLLCDEAQSLKNAASQRWKSLLNLRCRNRVLLTGTPIQNSMAELWALLHFIMPEFFDSHEEFNEWFSREIEDAAEEEQKQASKQGGKGGRQKSALSKRSTFQSRQLARLHLILKPFMLRRVKKDVENEMPPKVELLLDCPLSRRQRMYYRALTAKVRGAANFHSVSGGGVSDKLMNLVMQFRKVVNHPQLMLHHRTLSSPLLFSTPHHFAATRVQSLSSVAEVHSTASSPFASPLSFPWPARLMRVTDNALRDRWLYSEMSIFAAHYIHRSLTAGSDTSTGCVRSPFSFSRFVCLSPAELSFLCRSDPLLLWLVEEVRVHRFNQLRAPLLSSLLMDDPISATRSRAGFTAPLLHGTSSPAGRSVQSLLLVRSVECPLLAPRVLTSVPLRARLRVRSTLSSCLTLTSRSGADDNSTAGGSVSKQSTIDEALTQADRVIGMQPFGLDQTRLHPAGDGPLGLLGHHRQLLTGLACCLPRVVAPLPFPYLPGTASPSLRARLGYPGYCGWETSVLTGMDLTSHASVLSAPPLAAGERVPASFEISHSVAPDAWMNRWQGLSAVSILSPASAPLLQSAVSSSGATAVCPPHTALPGPLSPELYVCPPTWFVAPTPLQLISDSGKLQRLDALLSKLHSNGHRVLIFSQMTRMLDLLGEYLLFRRYRYARLDGQTSLADRRDLVRRFQSDPSIFAFILSTRAGGLGINLTAADTVIFFDNDWNPTQDAQAMDRSHRIGQNKPVTVYRMVCRHTVEERILNRAQVKFNIQKNVYAGGFKLQKENKNKPADGDTNDDENEHHDTATATTEAAQRRGTDGEEEDGQQETAVEPAIDPSTLFKSSELRDLMLAEEDDQAWDTDYYHSHSHSAAAAAAAGSRGRDRLGKAGGRYGADIALEHEMDIADTIDDANDADAMQPADSAAAKTTKPQSAPQSNAPEATANNINEQQRPHQSQQPQNNKSAGAKPPRQPTKAERAAAERLKRKEEKQNIKSAKEAEKREREEERRRKREAKQREKEHRDKQRKIKAAEKQNSNSTKTAKASKKKKSGSAHISKGKKRERIDAGSSSDSSNSSRSSSSSSSSSSASSSSSSSSSSSASSRSSSSSTSAAAQRKVTNKSKKKRSAGKKTTQSALGGSSGGDSSNR